MHFAEKCIRDARGDSCLNHSDASMANRFFAFRESRSMLTQHTRPHRLPGRRPEQNRAPSKLPGDSPFAILAEIVLFTVLAAILISLTVVMNTAIRDTIYQIRDSLL